MCPVFLLRIISGCRPPQGIYAPTVSLRLGYDVERRASSGERHARERNNCDERGRGSVSRIVRFAAVTVAALSDIV